MGGGLIKKNLLCIVVALSAAPVSVQHLYADSAIESVCPPSVIFETLALNRDLPTLQKPKYLSPTDLVPSLDGMLLFVAEQTAKRIDVVDVEAQMVVRRIRLPSEVTGIAVAPEGTTLYATCSSDLWPAGMVCVVDVAGSRVIGRIPVGHGARAPVITPDGKRLYVCNRFDNDLSVVDLSSGKVMRRIEVVREPYCADITPDGKTLVVGNLLPADLSTDTNAISSKISLIDAVSNTLTAHIRLRRGSHNVQGIAVSADGQYAFATHQICAFYNVASTVEKGWGTKNDIAVIDITQKKLINEVSLDQYNHGMGHPWGIRCSDDGKFLCVTHAGNHELSIIDYPKMMDTVFSRTDSGRDIQKDFSVLMQTRKRVLTGTAGPRALAIINDKAYTAGYFSDSAPLIKAFELSLYTTAASASIMLDEPQRQTVERYGEALFFDAEKLCFQSWRSCHSCHPFGRVHGLNQILGGQAVVAPKNTRSLVYSWWTPPTTWTGRRGHAQQAIPAAIELELFRISTRELAEPLDTFAMYLKPVPSPYREKGRFGEAALRGRAIFYNQGKTDCSKCHTGSLFTDNMGWNAGVTDPYDANTQWVTPGLREAWRTGPYNHLGSMTMREIIELPTMSNASVNLTPQEIEDLVAYVLSL
ncbi:MAG: c-type cytochrome [Chitinispirillaceae bacterium]|nr:c-type cytochrome [Chitinispirillaceae bacterium]